MNFLFRFFVCMAIISIIMIEVTILMFQFETFYVKIEKDEEKRDEESQNPGDRPLAGIKRTHGRNCRTKKRC